MNRTTDARHERQSQHTDRKADQNVRKQDLRKSPMMVRLLDALHKKTDIGHFGQFTFVTVARHFMDEDEITRLLSNQTDMDEAKARALLLHVKERGYNPPRRERIIEQQSRQGFQLIPDPADPDFGNLYRELQFPDGVYEDIEEYYEGRAEART